MKKFITILLLALLVLPFATIAAPVDPGVTLPSNTMTNTGDLFTYISVALNWFFYALLVLAVIFILMIALNYVMAGGDTGKAKDNGKKLSYVLIGIVIALIAKGLVFVTCNLVTGGQPCRF